MVDRIEKLDPKLYRVDEAADDREEQGRQETEEGKEEKRESDKFDKGRPVLKKLIEKGGTAGGGEPEETSLSFSQRLLVLWGVLDIRGKPRVPVILTYGMVVTVILISTFLIFGILWR